MIPVYLAYIVQYKGTADGYFLWCRNDDDEPIIQIQINFN